MLCAELCSAQKAPSIDEHQAAVGAPGGIHVSFPTDKRGATVDNAARGQTLAPSLQPSSATLSQRAKRYNARIVFFDFRLLFMSATTTLSPAELELATLMVKTLNLEIQPSEIEPDAPIYGEGLGLDSIDILEISLAVSKQYGVQLKADDENNKVIYRSVRNLSAHVEAHRSK
jgi:acyl carrier protein